MALAEEFSDVRLSVQYLRALRDLKRREGLSWLPDEVTEWSKLKELTLKDNNLPELPTSINKLNRLQRLNLDGNNLTELPAEIGDLKELVRLSVSNNQLVGLPTSIQKQNA